MKVRPWLEGMGLSLIYLLPALAVALSPTQRNLYHQLLPATTLVRGLALDFFGLGLLFGLYFVVVHRSEGKRRSWLMLPVLFPLAWSIARGCAFWIQDVGTRGRFLHRVPLVPFAVVAVVLLLVLFWPRAARYVMSATLVLLAAAGVSGLLLVAPRMLWQAGVRQKTEAGSFQRSGASRSPLLSGGAPRRIIWLLFDELSYNQVYDHRQASVQMPAFDALARESVLFSQLRPVGDRTDVVIPSLFLGERFTTIKSSARGDLLWTGPGYPEWQPFDPQRSIFSRAQQEGWHTGVAGWFNPYCRLLAPVLDRCFWVNSEPLAGELFTHLSSRMSTLSNALYALPLAAHVRVKVTGESLNAEHLDDYQQLIKEAGSVIADQSVDFAFIHLPVPHPPGIYQRPGVGPHRSSYLDNLVLADHALAALRGQIAQTPEAGQTVLIVSSDHSWRVKGWRGAEGWTREEERASDGGVFDDRPVLMVRYPGETDAHRLDKPASAMAVHGLLVELLAGRLGSEAELERWLARAGE